MIKTLKRKISLLLGTLTGIIFMSILLAFNWTNYQQQLYTLKSDFRSEIQDMGWISFVKEDYDKNYFDGYEYCVIKKEDNGKLTFISDYYPEKNQEELLEYAREIIELNNSHPKRKIDSIHFSVIYMEKVLKNYGTYIILINGKTAIEASLPYVWKSMFLGVLGLFLLIFVCGQLSHWLVRPVEDTIYAEKNFISNASHELKTPLTIIGTNASLLSKEIGENKHLSYIQQETNQMSQLIQKMLTLVKLNAPVEEEHFKKFCASDALFEIIDPMESVAYEKNLKLDIQIQEQMSITGIEEQFKSVISILLDNAISYTPEHGHISVKSCILNHNFYLKVANTGAPIPKEEREMLFKRFYRQDKSRTGNDTHFGLGLSIAGNIVANHHGAIQVDSEGGENCFTVILPVKR